MEPDVVVRQHMTERYLLDELEPQARDEFEEHFFDCPDCALDVRAGAMFVEQSKIALAEKSESIPTGLPVNAPVPTKAGWVAGLGAGLRPMWRPAFAVPVMALLLAVIGYQNLVTYPQPTRQLNSPQVLPWAPVNVGTYGSEGPVITAHPGQGFLLFVRIPPDGSYSHYTAELYNPGGKLEWSLTIPVASGEETSAQDQWPVQVTGASREAGSYTLTERGATAAGESKDFARTSSE